MYRIFSFKGHLSDCHSFAQTRVQSSRFYCPSVSTNRRVELCASGPGLDALASPTAPERAASSAPQPFPRRVIRATWSNTANGASACAAPCVCTRRARPLPRRPDGGSAASPSAQESPAALVVATAPRPPARPCPASRICFACSQISEVDPSRSVCSVRGSFGAAASSAGTRLHRSFIS